MLARFLSVENVERDADLALMQARGAGATCAGMLRQAHAAAARGPRAWPPCRANASNPRLRRAGAVKILSLNSKTAYSLTGATGKTRLAWTVIGKLPVVQCIDVHRSGQRPDGDPRAR